MDNIPNPCPSLPQDIIFEILTRVSFETLRRCRLARKDWNKLTHKSSFMDLYCRRTGTASGYFIQASDKHQNPPTFVSCYKSCPVESLSLDFLPEDVKIEAVSKQGLVFCVSSPWRSKISRYYVCKPTTREWVRIPNPKTKFVTKANAMMVLQSCPSHYKIIRFSKPRRQAISYFTMICEIFDSANGAWKRSENIKLPNHMFLSDKPAIYANGAFHWLTISKEIFSFHINSEKWRLIPLPEEAVDKNRDYFHRVKLVQREGNLAFFDEINNQVMILWVMQNYSKQTWKKTVILVNSSSARDHAVDLYTNDVALVQGYDDIIWYNFNNQTSISTKVVTHFFSREIFPFQSDFESVFSSV